MTNPVPAKRFYPNLAEVVSLENFPAVLDFVKTKIQNKLNEIYYKGLQVSKSARGDKASYRLSVISNQRLDFEIGTTGTFLVINPDDDSTLISSFPIELAYEWPILAYLKKFNEGSFGEGVQEFFDLAIQILELSDETLISRVLNEFAEPDFSSSNNNIQQFVADVNAANLTGASTIVFAGNSQASAKALVTELNAKIPSMSISQIIFDVYVLDSSESETGNPANSGKTWQRILKFFKVMLPEHLDVFVKDLITPRVYASIELSAAVELSRDLLIPCKLVDGVPVGNYDLVNGELQKARFDFGSSVVSIDSKDGLGFDMGIQLSTSQPLMHESSEIIFDINSLKLDLSDSRNIIEADADGRSEDFKGVYVESATVYLPKKWFDLEEDVNNPNPTLSGTNLLIGNPDGVSGSLALNVGDSLNFKFFGTDVFLTEFAVQYKKNKVVSGSVSGTIKVPNLKDANGNLAELDTRIMYSTLGYWVQVEEPEGIQLTLGRFISITLKKLAIGKREYTRKQMAFYQTRYTSCKARPSK